MASFGDSIGGTLKVAFGRSKQKGMRGISQRRVGPVFSGKRPSGKPVFGGKRITYDGSQDLKKTIFGGSGFNPFK